ncbi:Surface antigen msp4 [Ehrlichia minasensis]|nr:Surface antigen msp4 [Ehrlichia minasensis]
MENFMRKKHKLITFSVALFYILSLPHVSFAENTNSNKLGLYISLQYNPSVSVFSNFSAKETSVNTQQLMALKKDIDSIEISYENNKGISMPENFTVLYVPKFQDNFAGFSSTLGFFYSKGLRIEIGASYEKFDVKDPGGYTKIKDAYRYFALAREMHKSSSSVIHIKKEENNNNTKGVHYVVIRNDGISISSATINGCYDFSFPNLPLSPYTCVGIGIDAIEFLNALHIKFACQGKLGFTYSVSPNVNLFADGYYHKVMGNKFKNLPVQYVDHLEEYPSLTSAIATLDIGYLGGEIGVRFIF